MIVYSGFLANSVMVYSPVRTGSTNELFSRLGLSSGVGYWLRLQQP